MKNVSALIAGILFGMGLALSGMTDTQKVIGFLDVFGDWDPDLMLMMAAAVITTSIGFKILFRHTKKPLFNPNFSIPKNQVIDKKLILGALIFGVGWGLYGYCPGPAIASLVYGSPVTLAFVVAMVLGMLLVDGVLRRLSKIEMTGRS